MIIVSPLTPRLSRPLRRQPDGGVRHVCWSAVGLLLFRALERAHAVLVHPLSPSCPLVGGHGAGHVADDGGDHVGRAGPPGRRRLGHERRHPRAGRRPRRRRDGQHRRVAVHDQRRPAHRHLPPATQAAARTSLADALAAAGKLPSAAGQALRLGAEHAFIDGIHLAVTAGAILALIAAVIVVRYLPHHLAAETSLHGPVEAMEDTAELGLAGVLPAFADRPGPRAPD